MSHEITKIDRQQGIVQAWHGLTQIVPDLSLENNWLTEWDLIARPMFINDDDGNPVKTEFSRFVASDNPRIFIGKPFSESYTPITNAMFLEVLRDSVLGIDDLNLESVGSVSARGKVFASFKIGSGKRNIGGRTFESYLNFGSSHDMSAPFWFNTSNICTVCANTFGMNLAEVKAESGAVQGRIRHTKNAGVKLAEVESIIAAALGAQAEFDAIFASLDEVPANETNAKRIFAGFLGKGEEMGSRTANRVERLTDLYKSGKGNNGRTMADVFSAVTDLYTHESAGKDDMQKQFVSSEFGAARDVKIEFFDLMKSDESRDTLEAKGKRSLELTAAN